jgi:hypothetical protein
VDAKSGAGDELADPGSTGEAHRTWRGSPKIPSRRSGQGFFPDPRRFGDLLCPGNCSVARALPSVRFAETFGHMGQPNNWTLILFCLLSAEHDFAIKQICMTCTLKKGPTIPSFVHFVRRIFSFSSLLLPYFSIFYYFSFPSFVHFICSFFPFLFFFLIFRFSIIFLFSFYLYFL